MWFASGLNLDKTFLILAGDALKLRIPSLKDVHGNLVKCVPFESTLGFDLGPLVIPHGVVRSRGNSLLTSMNQYKLVWQSDLDLKKKMPNTTNSKKMEKSGAMPLPDHS